MRITQIEITLLRDVPLPRPIRPAYSEGRIVQRHDVALLKLHTDTGLTGLGPASMGGPGQGNMGLIRDTLGPQLLGQDPCATERHVRLLRRAGGGWGLEIALWDLIGKAAGLPLYKLWGGYTDRIRGYASTMEMGTPAQRAEDALGFLKEGFTAIKLRLHHARREDDLALVRAVRDAVGDRMEIMVDANQAQTPVTPSAQTGPIWDYYRALATARGLEELDVRWLEEPLSRYDFEGLARLAQHTRIPLAGAENNRYLHEFHWLLEQGCYDILQPDALISEGIGQLRKIAALAEVRAKLCVPHHGGGGIGTAAHLHFSASVPNSPYVELLRDRPGEFSQAAQTLLVAPFMVDEEGYVPLPEGPGLGIAFDEERVRRYTAETIVVK